MKKQDIVTLCAVPECKLPTSGPNNLCDEHRLPGMCVTHTDHERTFVVTAWYAEHDGEPGIIFLNDWALGDLFSGRERFEARLARQGFVNVRNIATLAELERAKQLCNEKRTGAWSGPWLTQYPWELTETPQK